MRIKIHRGAEEIGGSCVQLESQGASILLDLGMPLDAAKPDPSLLPRIDGLIDGGNAGLLGIIVSHSHGDHYGLTGLIHASLPIFIGNGAKAVLQAAKPFMPRTSQPKILRTYTDGASFGLGPFKITPHLTDHSAFDSYSLLIQAEGKSVFYSGDLRAHGRKRVLVERLIQNPPANIDALLMEGTTFSRNTGSSRQQTEEELEDEIAGVIKNSTGLVLAVFSPQNIDRLATFYSATKRAGRTFVADAYLAQVLHAADPECSLGIAPSDLRIYLPELQKQRIVRQRNFNLVAPFKKNRIYKEGIARSPNKWVMLFRNSMAAELSDICSSKGASLIFSLWGGYLDRPEDKTRSWCATHRINFFHCHTSGHADPATLMRYASALKPRRIIPIHTAAPEAYKRLFPNTVTLRNGEWLQVP